MYEIYEDSLLDKAVSKVLTMIHGEYNNKVGLAIHIASEEYGVSTKEIS